MSEETDKKPKRRALQLLEAAGAGAIIMAVVLYFATTKMIDQANKHMADLMARIGAAEEHSKILEQKLTEYDSIIQRLSKADPEKLAKTLDVLERPDVKPLVDAQEQDRRIKILARQVGQIYSCAQWSSELPRTNIPNLFRNSLYGLWVTNGIEFSIQSSTGELPDEWMNEPDSDVVAHGMAYAINARDEMMKDKMGDFAKIMAVEKQQSFDGMSKWLKVQSENTKKLTRDANLPTTQK